MTQGNPPLFHAARHGNQEFCRFLVERGAYINMKSEGGNTALHMAFQSGNLGTCLYLLEQGADPNCLNYERMTPLAFGPPSLLRVLGVSDGVVYSDSKVYFDNGRLWRKPFQPEVDKGPIARTDYSSKFLLKQPPLREKVHLEFLDELNNGGSP